MQLSAQCQLRGNGLPGPVQSPCRSLSPPSLLSSFLASFQEADCTSPSLFPQKKIPPGLNRLCCFSLPSVCVYVCVCVYSNELVKQICSRATLMRPGGDEEGAGREGKGEGGVGGHHSKTRCCGSGGPKLHGASGLPCCITASPLASCLLSSLPALLLSGFLPPTDLSLSKLYPLEARACIFSPTGCHFVRQFWIVLLILWNLGSHPSSATD